MRGKCDATGVNPTQKALWVYFEDKSGVVSRMRAVKVPWSLITDVYPDVCDQVNHEYARRMEAEQEVVPLPLEAWE